MSAWLLSIVGVVSLGVLIELLLPEGENSKYIKGIFSVIVIFVIVSPLPKLVKGESVDWFSPSGGEIQMDDTYYQSAKEDIQRKLIQSVEDKLKENGYNDLSYDIQFDEEYVYLFDSIAIDSGGMSDEEWMALVKYIQSAVGRIEVKKR